MLTHPRSLLHALLAAALLLTCALPARANLRAPRTVLASPSGGLHGSVTGLSVRGEQLRFDCDFVKCKVTANYAVRAAQAGRFAFVFVLPAKQPIAVKVGSTTPAAAVDVAVEETTEVAPAHQRVRDKYSGVPATFEAKFEAALAAGDGTISVEYEQPLGAQEHDYGYFKKGRMVSDFEYILGPIKEWTLEPGFRIDLMVSIPREPPGWWKRKMGTTTGVACADLQWNVFEGTGQQSKDRYEYSVAFVGKVFPERIECFLGDADLLPKRRKYEK